jgi:alkaline phosphatase
MQAKCHLEMNSENFPTDVQPFRMKNGRKSSEFTFKMQISVFYSKILQYFSAFSFRYIHFALFAIFYSVFQSCQTTIDLPRRLPRIPADMPARNVVLIIGDGMGLSQISSLVLGEDQPSAFERFGVIGFQKTHSSSDLITDSAAGATAMATGVKTYNGAIGVNADTIPVQTLIERCEEEGLSTGMLTTATIVHATPAAFAAHRSFREQYEGIALDYLEQDIDFLVGGGQKFFERRETDGADLTAAFRRKGYAVYSYFDRNLETTILNTRKNVLFFTADNQPVSAQYGRTYLPKATRLGLNFLDQHGDKGFFFLVEGGQVDWAGHYNQPDMLDAEMKDLHAAILEALSFALTDGTTLVVVTADHETGGLGLHQSEKDKNRLEYRYTTNGHTASLVPVFAFGPGAHHFSGIYENTGLHANILKALQWATPSTWKQVQ